MSIASALGLAPSKAELIASATRQLRMLAGRSGRTPEQLGEDAGIPGNAVRHLMDPATASAPVDVLIALTPHVVDPRTRLDPKTLAFVTADTTAPRGNSTPCAPHTEVKPVRILSKLLLPGSHDHALTAEDLSTATSAKRLNALSELVARPDELIVFTNAREDDEVSTVDAAAFWRLTFRKLEDNAEAFAAMQALEDQFPASSLAPDFLALGRASVTKLAPFHRGTTRSGRWLVANMDAVALWLMRTEAAEAGKRELGNELIAPAYATICEALQGRHKITVPASEAALVVAARCYVAA